TSFVFSPKDLWSDDKTNLRIPNANRINEEKDFQPVLLDSTFQCPGSGKSVKQVSKSVLGVQAALVACKSCFDHCIAADTGLVVDKTGTNQFVYGPTRDKRAGILASVRIFCILKKCFVRVAKVQLYKNESFNMSEMLESELMMDDKSKMKCIVVISYI
ncbi:hypothetical protein BC833DRAFT_620241, partial [Globomyces pollinis-pini]